MYRSTPYIRLFWRSEYTLKHNEYTLKNKIFYKSTWDLRDDFLIRLRRDFITSVKILQCKNIFVKMRKPKKSRLRRASMLFHHNIPVIRNDITYHSARNWAVFFRPCCTRHSEKNWGVFFPARFFRGY